MAKESFAFRVAGIEPRTDPAWHLAGPLVHRAFWRAVVAFVIEAKDRELAAGRDRFGRELVPIAPSTRAKGRWRSYTGLGTPDNPPLTPANPLSRTRALFTGRAMADHAEFFWKRDVVTGRHWGQILGYHRQGVSRPGRPFLPRRDVIGLSPSSLLAVRRKANVWWSAWKAGSPFGAVEAERMRVHVPAAEARPRIVATGRIDIERATFGIGGSRAAVAQRIAAGTSTGFRQLPAYRLRGR